MNEEVLHIMDSQILDIVVSGNLVTVYFLGGTSTEEMESGGVRPDMYDILLEFATEDQAVSVRSALYQWYAESESVTVVAFEDGGATMTNEYSHESVRVTCDHLP